MDAQRRRRAEAIRGLIAQGWSPPSPNDAQMDRMLDDMARVHATATLRLSPTEYQVLALTGDGLTRSEIADVLGLGVETVKEYLSDVYKRLGARNAAHAVALGFRKGVLR